MTREDEIAKLDLEQAKANFEIETDPGRHDEPPAMDFDRLGICRGCRMYKYIFSGDKPKYWCLETMRYWYKTMTFCEDNARVTEVMKPYYERK